ncbi:MAG: transcription termination factor Rho [Thermodesulfobacteriota bacterium]
MADEPQEQTAEAAAPAKQPPQPKKPLDRMTAKELREYALELGGIVGVHGMNKEELLTAIKAGLGITDESGAKLFAKEIHAVKGQIKGLKTKRDEARQTGDAKKVDSLRRRISRLKKKTRRLAAAG